MQNKNRAFTLIELLVVIAIIGLLATIVSVSVNNARKKARDAQRVADLKQMAMALELYYDNNNAYPSYGGARWLCGLGDAVTFCGNTTADGYITASYISKIPRDPIRSGNLGCRDYIYQTLNSGQGFRIWAQLENEPAGTAGYNCTAFNYNVVGGKQ